jgi:hypothetical protein
VVVMVVMHLGFARCRSFDGYVEDLFSIFMTREL